MMHSIHLPHEEHNPRVNGWWFVGAMTMAFVGWLLFI
jgi:hypothetical protein